MSERPTSKQIRVGVVGTGWVSTARHIPAFKRDRRATIAAVLDRNQSKAESIARQFRIPRSFQHLDEFLQEPLDVVSVCTPPWVHASVAEKALQSGKHVLVEKPMTLTSEEGRHIEAVASELGVLLCPAHNFLFSRSMQQAETLIRKGETGEIQWAMGVQLSSWRRRLPTWLDELPGGLFFDEAPHLLYLMQHFLGDLEIEQAWRTNSPSDLQPKMERVEARLQGAQGAGYLTMWTGAPVSEWLFVLYCSHAVLVLDLFRDILIHLPPEKAHNASDVLKLTARGTRQLWAGVGAMGIRHMRKQLFFGHDLLVKSFLDAVIDRKASPVSAQMGWKTIALIEKVLQSASKTV
ncbi:MAG: Gfo/Idh/MocA family oxidoreductase [Dehalococcoidales bacterium]|nr:Gfo/Idh/MocA family oxidoreductase [Dehalococcoidales bacterium]